MYTKKTQYCQNNPKNCYTEKKAKYKPSGYARCSICSFDDTKNKRYFYRGKDCIETFCKDLKELGTEMINFKKREMKFKGEFECLGENTEKYITFSVPLKKENDNDNSKKNIFKLRFIDSYRFMSTSLSNLVDNLSGGYDKECKKCMERKKN